MKRYVAWASVAALIGIALAHSSQPQRSEHGGDSLPSDVSERLPPSGRDVDTGSSLVQTLRADRAMGLAQRPVPRSLQGTEIDGALVADAEGHLIVGPGVIALFEYFFSASGEESDQVIRARILAEIDKRLAPPAAQEARDLLERYLEYRERGRELFAEQGEADDLGARLRQIRELRRAVFGEDDAEALFGEEEKQDYIAVAQREIARNTSIPAEERRRRIEELEQMLPEPVRKAKQEALKPLRFLQEQERLRAEGASAAEIRALRESWFGSEAADRLEAYDREEARWQERFEEYRAARRGIESNPALGESERLAAIEALRTSRFTEGERRRVEALERIEEQGG